MTSPDTTTAPAQGDTPDAIIFDEESIREVIAELQATGNTKAAMIMVALHGNMNKTMPLIEALHILGESLNKNGVAMISDSVKIAEMIRGAGIIFTPAAPQQG